MATFDEVLALLRKGKSVELRVHLCSILFSRHELTLVGGKIEDFSYVDDSTNKYTIKQYRKSFYGKRFKSNAVVIEEIYER